MSEILQSKPPKGTFDHLGKHGNGESKQEMFLERHSRPMMFLHIAGGSHEDIAAYGRKRGTEDYKWRACLIPCRLVFEKGNHPIPVTGGFLRKECQELFSYRSAK